LPNPAKIGTYLNFLGFEMANTKLTPDQKNALKEMKEPGFFGVGVCVDVKQAGDTTIAWVDRGNTVEFALSVMSPDEQKNRAKVGTYHALARFYDGFTVKMAKRDFEQMCDYVYGFGVYLPVSF
jgi:hypothetical protein